MTIKILRRRSTKWLLICLICVTIVLFAFHSHDSSSKNGLDSDSGGKSFKNYFFSKSPEKRRETALIPLDICPRVEEAGADINTLDVYKNFNFHPNWVSLRSFWDQKFEERYLLRKTKHKNLPLKVFLMFWSHNDPGWLRTVEEYYDYQTGNILKNMVQKLTEYKQLTFTWTEMSYLSMFWDKASEDERRVLKGLIDERRLEITTGGWVMTDEASAHLYAMVDQLIEGHQWLHHEFGVRPESGWSVDPFGHGATVPYLLKNAGLEQMVIQRIHFAWKEWLAAQQAGDFKWRQSWDPSGAKSDILCHNMPYDIYSIKHTCGPHHEICLAFDFRKIHGELTEFSVRSQDIDAVNIHDKASTLIEEYRRTASLYPHNVVLVPVGDDFRFDHAQEWDQQFKNYKKLVDYINANPEFNAEVQFGTVRDYFKAIREWTKDFPTLKGDFFVYADVFSDGEPAYWSGYFTTRPFWKAFSREAEGALRTAEILFTAAYQNARQQRLRKARYELALKTAYDSLVSARRNVAVFQHHDAITGTSKFRVTADFAMKLFDAFHAARRVQALAVQALVDERSEEQAGLTLSSKYSLSDGVFILHARDRPKYDQLTQQVPIYVSKDERRVFVFNSHAHRRVEPVYVLVKYPDVEVTDADGKPVKTQMNPVWNMTKGSPNLLVSTAQYELIILADLQPLSLTTFHLKRNTDESPASLKTSVYCNFVGNRDVVDNFRVQIIPEGDVQLENPRFRLVFSGKTKLLKKIVDKKTGKESKLRLHFGQYVTAPYQSGAYLLKVEMPTDDLGRPLSDEEGLPFLNPNIVPRTIITSGPLESEITVIFDRHLLYSIRLYHAPESPITNAIKFTTLVNLAEKDDPPGGNGRFTFSGTDAFVRFVTDIDNGEKPVFYTDAGGYQMLKREKVAAVKVEGNYYPITTAAYIQDAATRLTLLTSHARGATSLRPGELELALDRRSKADDARGMGEGVTDNTLTRADGWLLFEPMQSVDLTGAGEAPSLGAGGTYSPLSLSFLANHLSNGLNYPPTVYVVDTDVPLRSRVTLLSESEPLSCDVHLLTLRTRSAAGNYSEPGTSALMVLQRQAYSCGYGSAVGTPCPVTESTTVYSGTKLTVAEVVGMEETTLTGLESRGRLQTLSRLELAPMELKTLKLDFS